MSQDKRVVLITGGADSVGRTTAEAFDRAGYQVAIIDINSKNVADTLTCNPEMIGDVGSVGEPSVVEALFEKVEKKFGRLDVLVNAVGIAGPTASIEDVTLDEWDATFTVNIRAMFHCMKCAIPLMKKRRSGAIINYSTAAVNTGLPRRSPYVASKCAVEGLTYTAARELGPFNIRCNAVQPGVIDNARMTNIITNNAAERGISAAEMEASYLKYVSMGSKISPAELADLSLYLASDSARHLTGQMIALSGLLEWEE